MKVVLELQDQPSNIKKVTVRHDVVIGRGAECNLRLSAPQVSRRHCFLRVNGDGASLTDLDSSNGTWMNGKKLNSGKRYNIEDGATLSVGPVKFVARVRSEVAVGEELQVQLQDDRIEAELSQPVDDSSAGLNADATIADLIPEDDHSNMDFAIEQGGIAAAEDEPTADYVPSDSSGGARFSNVQDIDAPDFEDDEILEAVPLDEPETIAAVDEAMIVDDDEIIEIGADDEIIEGAEIIEEDEAMVIDDDEVLVIDDAEVVLDGDADEVVVIDDEDVLVVDDDEIVEVAGQNDEALDVSGDEADELKNFLQGLD